MLWRFLWIRYRFCPSDSNQECLLNNLTGAAGRFEGGSPSRPLNSIMQYESEDECVRSTADMSAVMPVNIGLFYK